MSKFPFYKQLDGMDCGPTCLRMIAKHYGKTFSVQQLRERSFIQRTGVNLLGISEAAASIGLRTTGVRTTIDRLKEQSKLPCILHWNQEHFVVLYRIEQRRGKTYFYIADPAYGLLKYEEAELKKCWVSTTQGGQEKGIAMLVDVTPQFYETEPIKYEKLSLWYLMHSRLYERLSVLKRMRDWGLVPVHHSISKGYRAIADLKPCKEQVAAAFDGLKEVAAQSPFPVIMNRQAIELRYRYASVGKCPFEGSKCTALRTHLFILPDGKVTVCEQLYWNPRFIVGDVTTESIREVWNSEKAMRLWQLDKERLSSDSPCKECPVMEVCYSERNRCWADVIKAYGEEGWDYPDPRCERAPELKNRLNYDS